jgi:cytoskeletal protein RodZ
MFEFWREWRKSAEEKRQERINAFLDDALSPAERQRFEEELAADAALQAEVARLRVLKQQLRQLPSRPVPRQFMLDPAKYGRPAPQPLFQFYPVLRTATVLTGIFLVIAISLSMFQNGAQLQGIAFQAEPEIVEVTRVVTESVVEEGDAIAEEDVAVEELAMEQTAVQATEAPLPAPAAEMAPEAAAEAVEEAEVPAEVPAEAPAANLAAEEPAAEDAADGALASPALTPTITPLPTATPSELPRMTATAVPSDRVAEDSGEKADVTATAVPAPAPTSQTQRLDVYTILFIILAVIFVLLLAATLWVRRQL